MKIAACAGCFMIGFICCSLFVHWRCSVAASYDLKPEYVRAFYVRGAI